MNNFKIFIRKNEKYFGDGMINNPILNSFIDKFVKKDINNLDISRKLEGDSDHFCRINIRYVKKNDFYKDDLYDKGLEYIKYLNALNLMPNIKIDTEEIIHFYKSITPEALGSLSFGIDLRPNYLETRIKIWIEIFEESHWVKEILKKFNADEYICKLNPENNITVSFNFHCNDSCKTKYYYPIYDYVNNENLQGHFSKVLDKKTVQALENSDFAYLGFPEPNRIFAYFANSKDIRKILKMLELPEIDNKKLLFNNELPYGFGCFEDFYVDPNGKTPIYNFYYDLTHLVLDS